MRRFHYILYSLAFTLVFPPLAAGANAAPKDRAAVEKIIDRSKSFGGRGWGFNFKSLDELSEKLSPADAPMAVALLYDGKNQTGASFAVTALCDAGADALAARLAGDDPPPIDRAWDSLNMMQSFHKCTAETRAKAQALMLELDAARNRKMERLQKEREARDAAQQRMNEMQMKLLTPEGRKSLTPAERQEIFEANVKAMHLDGKRDAGQEKMYQMMKKSTLGDGP